MNCRQLAEKLQVCTPRVRDLLLSGMIKAKKEKGRWRIDENSVAKFVSRNNRKLKEIEEQYVSLYWQGLTVKQLQKRVREDFDQAGILHPVEDFAEKAIYNSRPWEAEKSR